MSCSTDVHLDEVPMVTLLQLKEESVDSIDVSDVTIKDEIERIDYTYNNTFTNTINSINNIKASFLDPLSECDTSVETNSNNEDNAADAPRLTNDFVVHKRGAYRFRKHQLLECPTCNGKYTKSYIKLHMQTHTENKPKSKRVECEVCKVTVCAQALPGHMRIHTGEKPFVCATCGRQFRKACLLREHEQTHTDVRPFVCPTCNKGFKRKTYLKEHVRIHTGEKPYCCEFCGKKFGFSHGYTIHMKIHNNDKRFVCSICQHACISRSNLDIHMVKHTKERKFECPACGFKFGRAVNLHTHVLRWCKGEPKKKTKKDSKCVDKNEEVD